MYEPGFPACKYGLAEHTGERICVVCGKVFDAATRSDTPEEEKEVEV
jgi:uncharacterized Zn finger protein (UPF0148 family)